MPQPFLRVNPNAKLVFAGNSGPSENRPELALLAMKVISEWSLTELSISNLFIGMLGANPRPAAVVYGCLSGTAAQKAALTAVANLIFDDELRSVFDGVIWHFSRAAKMRNRIVHWVWGYSPDIPDAVVLINPQAVIEHNVIGKDVETQIAKIRAGQKPDTPFLPIYENAYLYYAQDFEELTAAIREVNTFSALLNQVLHFAPLYRNSVARQMAGNMLNSLFNSGYSTADEEFRRLLDQLKAMPRMAEFLYRRQQRQKSGRGGEQQSPDSTSPE